ncbi:hypothetical protein H696_01383 [Fonticula alba]|uniref:HIT-type domain-containing protein n=1 Tax=Fonticula alba TaxID=691883 RepID=A0A058ZC44_FONAL|nr:hypothetical protein H696_01383 [Fonticula alba]KCV71975.1 hypothetical protein H696_01383 [Fonticula alba]|eukprot:XP_009493553.1 hypothetical protein H696_01383 [Fonticula alba]
MDPPPGAPASASPLDDVSLSSMLSSRRFLRRSVFSLPEGAVPPAGAPDAPAQVGRVTILQSSAADEEPSDPGPVPASAPISRRLTTVRPVARETAQLREARLQDCQLCFLRHQEAPPPAGSDFDFRTAPVAAPYRCNRCQVPYCSVRCFADSPLHVRCREDFSRDQVVGELRGKRADREDGRAVVRALTRAWHEERPGAAAIRPDRAFDDATDAAAGELTDGEEAPADERGLEALADPENAPAPALWASISAEDRLELVRAILLGDPEQATEEARTLREHLTAGIEAIRAAGTARPDDTPEAIGVALFEQMISPPAAAGPGQRAAAADGDPAALDITSVAELRAREMDQARRWAPWWATRRRAAPRPDGVPSVLLHPEDVAHGARSGCALFQQALSTRLPPSINHLVILVQLLDFLLAYSYVVRLHGFSGAGDASACSPSCLSCRPHVIEEDAIPPAAGGPCEGLLFRDFLAVSRLYGAAVVDGRRELLNIEKAAAAAATLAAQPAPSADAEPPSPVVVLAAENADGQPAPVVALQQVLWYCVSAFALHVRLDRGLFVSDAFTSAAVDDVATILGGQGAPHLPSGPVSNGGQEAVVSALLHVQGWALGCGRAADACPHAGRRGSTVASPGLRRRQRTASQSGPKPDARRAVTQACMRLRLTTAWVVAGGLGTATADLAGDDASQSTLGGGDGDGGSEAERLLGVVSPLLQQRHRPGPAGTHRPVVVAGEPSGAGDVESAGPVTPAGRLARELRLLVAGLQSQQALVDMLGQSIARMLRHPDGRGGRSTASPEEVDS